jgi:hypothetical protein
LDEDDFLLVSEFLQTSNVGTNNVVNGKSSRSLRNSIVNSGFFSKERKLNALKTSSDHRTAQKASCSIEFIKRRL